MHTSTQLDLGRIFFLILLLTLITMTAFAGTVKGTITDRQTNEPLTGATVQVVGTSVGAVADLDGNYSLTLDAGTYTLLVRYVGYKDITAENVKVGRSETTLDFAMDADTQTLGEVSVVARKNLEGQRALQMERQKATLAIENLGAKEMTLKGISNVQEGVKKITGISIASAGQLIVRGLGDRYSTTTLNGLPIASPNPDNKLIPLDLFPASTVRNITVSKVYEAGTFADYSGAHIDISTKENTGSDFFSISFNVGGRFNTLFQDFYKMDQQSSLFRTPGIDSHWLNMTPKEFDTAIKSENPFKTDFDVKKVTSLPEFGGSLSGGKTWNVGDQELSLLAALNASNNNETTLDAFYRTLEAGGATRNYFEYDKYRQELRIGGLANVGLTLRKADHVGYTFFYARNAENNYMLRQGRTPDESDLVGSNSVTHIYTLQNHQVNGYHELGDRWSVNWSGSYSQTSSEEPDRRQIMFQYNRRGELNLFKLNRQETMRYFGNLDEDEWVGDLRSTYRYGEQNLLRFGATYKDKGRTFRSTRFYYNFTGFDPAIGSIYTPSQFMGYGNLANGDFSITYDRQPKDQYDAGSTIYAGFVDTEYYPVEDFLVNVGIRYERNKQWVNYHSDGGQAGRNELTQNDFFPAMNLKYTVNKSNSLRLSVSRTVTRPSFIEMAPFLYQESFGAAQIRGNADLKNGYNYNIDLRYERFDAENPENMFSITGYAKILQDPIERTQTLSGGAAVHSFQNADTGTAAGVEIEFRRELLKDLRLGVNGSYMYTSVKLPEGGAYTNNQRSLQGASPYLVNADLSYAPTLRNNDQLTATLLYNLQGPRIHAVGISGLGDEKQEALHTLDLVLTYKLNDHFSLKLEATDLINQDVVFNQKTNDGRTMEVERYERGTGIQVGFSYNL